jgi:hypothetical protein
VTVCTREELERELTDGDPVSPANPAREHRTLHALRGTRRVVPYIPSKAPSSVMARNARS